MHEKAFLRDRVAARDPQMVSKPIFSRVARNIKCPVLIAAGERGWLPADRASELYDGPNAIGRDVTLKIFTGEETASAQGVRQSDTCQCGRA
jgi:hypothetical protein